MRSNAFASRSEILRLQLPRRGRHSYSPIFVISTRMSHRGVVMADVLFPCTLRDDAKRITHLGNSRGCWSIGHILRFLEQGVHTAFVIQGSRARDIELMTDTSGKTALASSAIEVLSALPSCPEVPTPQPASDALASVL